MPILPPVLLTILLCCVVLPAGVDAARAQTGLDQIARGCELYEEAAFEAAIETLGAAMEEPGLSPSAVQQARVCLARAYVKAGRVMMGKLVFGQILEANPQWRPDQLYFPPDEMQVFEQALREFGGEDPEPTRSPSSSSTSSRSVTVPPPAAGSAPEGTKTPVPHQQTISANPFLFLFEWFNGEYERKVGPKTTLGVAGSYYSFGAEDDETIDQTYTNGNVLLRYYPQGAALAGFFMGGRMGMFQVKWDDGDYEGGLWTGDWIAKERTETVFGFGIEIGYNWVMGSERNFAISMGAGAIRLFGGDLEDADLTLTLPTIRLINVGILF